LVKVGHALQRAGVLPEGNLSDPEIRQHLFNKLDREILGSPWFAQKVESGLYPAPTHTMPYILRAAALEEKLEPRFLGRALYHLAQRRGFWSNRKTAPKKDEKPGEVENDIKTLRSELAGKTLGQYFATFSPPEGRIRDSWWTARDMYQTEFKAIWEQQVKHHPALLTEELRRTLYNAIFDQRPLKLKRSAVGQCEFEPSQRRAPAYLLISQRFRMLQVVNNIKVRPIGGQDRTLTADERSKLVRELERRSEMAFKEAREILGFTRRLSINLQRDREEAKLSGSDTGAEFYGVFRESWFNLSSEQQDRIVADTQSILSVRDADERAGRARKYLQNRGVENLDEACDRFLQIKFEAGYRNLSVTAMKRFLPLLEHEFPYGALSPHYRYLEEVEDELLRLVNAGVSHDAACKRLLNRKPEPITSLDALPPVLSEEVQRRIGAIRNPIVIRSLTELRKVVNAIVGKFGKPTRIHVELLRELKKARVVREKIWKENFAREKQKETIEKNIRDVAPNLDRVRPRDIEKYRLWQESEHCPYCLKTMTPRLMFGEDSEYQIDHIIPFGLSLDDSFKNKVLCHTECNRRKRQRTPFQAFGESPEGYDYDAMLKCVKSFRTDKDTREEKHQRFKMNEKGLSEYLAKRPAQQFNDSAYASRAAADYLNLLYGGRVDANGNTCVQARSGGLTKYFREAWNLNSILGDGGTLNGGRVLKPRHDHRHHAIDAAVIAATDQEMVERLNSAAKHGRLDGPGRFGNFDAPPRWPGFRSELKRKVIENVVVAHRVSKKVSGALHKDTNYSPTDWGENKHRHRVALVDLGEKDVMSDDVIADPGVRKLVRDKLLALGGGKPEKLFAVKENLPCFITADGRKIPVKKVRIEETVKTRKIGDGLRSRYVKPGKNHHLEIFGQPGRDGKDMKWETLDVVTMIDAHERLRNREPIVQKQSEPGWEFRFSLAQGEMLVFDEGPFKDDFFVVRTISEEAKTGSVKIEMVPINDARPKDKIKKSKLWITKSPNELRKWGARKVVVSPLGEVTEAHD